MAQVKLTLQIEMEYTRDAIADLALIHERLARRHGAAFRDLDRRIEGIVEGGFSAPGMHYLGAGVICAGVPVEIAAVIRDARSLGVI